MAKEIEHKYLCKYVPSYAGKPSLIQQGYIHVDKEKQVRIRIQDGKAILCVKLNNAKYRDEYEAELPVEEGIDLYNKCQYKLEKRRWSFNIGCYHCDIDRFNDGITIVEIETSDPELKISTEGLSFVDEECVDGKYEYTNYHYAGIPKV